MAGRFRDALDARLGHRALLRAVLDEPVPGGARFAYAPGSVVTALLLLQAATGTGLAFFYSPSSTGAWASLAYLDRSVPGGALLRGLHHSGASVLVVALGLHFVQVALFGAYRRPRELTWWSGLLLAAFVSAFALTGYLLPWDQRGYWATRVATGIAGSLPLVGPALQRLLEGGSGLGNLTITRCYALHVLVLPAATLLLAALHLRAFRRNGVTPVWTVPEGAPAGRFWPDQLWRDALLVAAAFALVMALGRHGAPLQGPADPSGHIEPRPEWYFRPLFELLRLLPPGGELAGTVLIPGAVIAFLVLLPFLDRAPDASPGRRLRPLAALAVLGLAGIGLLGRSFWKDAHDPAAIASEARADEEGRRARALAAAGVPPEGPLALLHADPVERGRRIFDRRCAGCHGPASPEQAKGPRLERVFTPAWIEGLLREPDDPTYYGHTKARGSMDSCAGLGAAKLRLLSDFLAQLGTHDGPPAALPPELSAGRAAFSDAGCEACHALTPGEASAGPNLAGYGGVRWIRALIDDPGGPLAYDGLNGMPSFGTKLPDADRAAVVAYVVSLSQ